MSPSSFFPSTSRRFSRLSLFARTVTGVIGALAAAAGGLQAELFFDSLDATTGTAIAGGNADAHFASDFRTGDRVTTVTLARFLVINRDSGEQQFTVRILRDDGGLPGEEVGVFQTFATVAAANTEVEPEAVPAVALSAGIPLEAHTTYWFDVSPNGDSLDAGFGIPQSADDVPALEYATVVTDPPDGGYRLSQDGGASYGTYTGPFSLGYQLEGFVGHPAPGDPAAYGQIVLADQPVAYYRFDEEADATEVRDSGGHNHHSLEINGVSFGHPGRFGSAGFFAGDFTSYVNVPLLLDPGSGKPFSIEAWVNSPVFSFAGDSIIVAQKDDGGAGSSLLFHSGASTDQFASFINGGQRLGTELINVKDNTWYHVVLTYSPDEFALRFYVNGAYLGESYLGSHPEATQGGWVIGSHNIDGIQSVSGLIDEVAIYDYRLDDPNGDGNTSDSRVPAHYPAGTVADLLIDWDFSPLFAPIQDNASAAGPLLEAGFANAVDGLASSDLQGSDGLQFSIGNPADGELNVKNWDPPVGVGSGVNVNYVFFTLTADEGRAIQLDRLTLKVWRNGAGAPDGIAFDVSLDGDEFIPFGEVLIAPDFGPGTEATYSFTDEVPAAREIEIRYTPRRVNAGSTGNHHISVLQVRGTLAGAPPPSTETITLNIAPIDATSVALSFATASGYTYQLQQNPGLRENEWSHFGESVAGDGADRSFVVELDGPVRFFRLLRSPRP